MPQPQEQKLQDVVASVTLASFTSLVAARTSATSITPSSARPTEPPAASCSQRLRLNVPTSRVGNSLIGHSGKARLA